MGLMGKSGLLLVLLANLVLLIHCAGDTANDNCDVCQTIALTIPSSANAKTACAAKCLALWPTFDCEWICNRLIQLTSRRSSESGATLNVKNTALHVCQDIGFCSVQRNQEPTPSTSTSSSSSSSSSTQKTDATPSQSQTRSHSSYGDREGDREREREREREARKQLEELKQALQEEHDRSKHSMEAERRKYDAAKEAMERERRDLARERRELDNERRELERERSEWAKQQRTAFRDRDRERESGGYKHQWEQNEREESDRRQKEMESREAKEREQREREYDGRRERDERREREKTRDEKGRERIWASKERERQKEEELEEDIRRLRQREDTTKTQEEGSQGAPQDFFEQLRKQQERASGGPIVTRHHDYMYNHNQDGGYCVYTWSAWLAILIGLVIPLLEEMSTPWLLRKAEANEAKYDMYMEYVASVSRFFELLLGPILFGIAVLCLIVEDMVPYFLAFDLGKRIGYLGLLLWGPLRTNIPAVLGEIRREISRVLLYGAGALLILVGTDGVSVAGCSALTYWTIATLCAKPALLFGARVLTLPVPLDVITGSLEAGGATIVFLLMVYYSATAITTTTCLLFALVAAQGIFAYRDLTAYIHTPHSIKKHQ